MAIAGSQIIPSARYKDAYAAIDWLCSVFGFTKQAVYGDGKVVHHAQLTLGHGMFMLGSDSNGGESAARAISLAETGGRETLGLWICVEDVDAVYERVLASRTEIVQQIMEPEYGGKNFACRDIEGHIWGVGSYNPWDTH